MTDYDDITLGRYMRVVVRQCILLHDIGFSAKTIDDLLEIMVDELIQLVKER